MQIIHRSLDQFRILGKDALRQFQVQIMRRNMIAVDEVNQGIHKIRVIEVDSGYVDRNWRRIPSLGKLTVYELADFLPHVIVQLRDKAVALKDRYKFVRKHDLTARLLPAHQCLRSVRSHLFQLVLRLEIDDKLLLCQRGIHLVNDMLFAEHFLSDLLRI